MVDPLCIFHVRRCFAWACNWPLNECWFLLWCIKTSFVFVIVRAKWYLLFLCRGHKHASNHIIKIQKIMRDCPNSAIKLARFQKYGIDYTGTSYFDSHLSRKRDIEALFLEENWGTRMLTNTVLRILIHKPMKHTD